MKEHSVIYLSPSDDPEREWCQDDAWEESVRYNLGTDFDRVTAERDAALGREAALREVLDTANGCLGEWRRSSLGKTLLENTALQQRLTAADERADRLEADKKAMTETHVLYTWLRKKCDQPSNDVVAVHMNIGHDWITVYDLDTDLRAMIEREQPCKPAEGGGDEI